MTQMMKPYGTPDAAAQYTCYRTRQRPVLDGRLASPAWQKAPRSPRFVDMLTGEAAIFDTRASALWDDENLYIGFWIEEPYVEASLTERDSLIFNDNDVEVFIDGGDCYYEFEINAFNTIYEVFFIWKDAYQRGGKYDVPEFDVFQPNALTFSGNFDRQAATFWKGTHPRGARWAFTDWDFPGLQTAVQVQGQINNRQVTDKGWQVELAFPWAGMGWLANGRPLPPKDGDTWRIFFGRFERLIVSGERPQPQPAWCWNKHGVLDTHAPECFTQVHFSTAHVEDL